MCGDLRSLSCVPEDPLDPGEEFCFARAFSLVFGRVIVGVGFCDVLEKLGDGWGIRQKVELPSLFDGKELALDSPGQRVVCLGTALREVVRLGFREQEPAALMDLDQLWAKRGVDVDKTPRRLQQAVDLLKGMNHALWGHSTQGPGEDREVEGAWFGGSSKLVELNLVKLDSTLQIVRKVLPCP